jgi:hypothetical protein
MKFVLGFVSVASLALAMGGCGSSSSGDGAGALPDFNAVNARFDKPDGTFNDGNASAVFQHGMDGSSSAADLDLSSGGSSSSSSSTTKKSVGLSLLSSGAFGACSPFVGGQQTGSCSCPAGGSLDYTLASDGNDGGAFRFNFNACATSNELIDGTEYFEAHSDTSDPKHPLYSFLLVVDATVTRNGMSKHLDLQARYGNGGYEIAVKVDDGYVVVSAKLSVDGKGGTWTVRDKNGSWTCDVANGHGTCTGSNGQTRKF